MKIVMVENIPSQGAALEALLSQQGHTVSRAGNCIDALRVIREDPQQDVLLFTLLLPGMAPATFLHRVWDVKPYLPVVGLTAGNDQDAHPFRERNITVLLKPCDSTTLLEELRNAVEQSFHVKV